MMAMVYEKRQQKVKPYLVKMGKLVNKMIDKTKEQTDKKRGEIIRAICEELSVDQSTLYRWIEAKTRPRINDLNNLARFGKEKAGMDRVWGESLFRLGGYSAEASSILESIWGKKELRKVPNNLPHLLNEAKFVGREKEIQKFMEELLIPGLSAVDGIGGVGKTRLVLEAALKCLKASTGEELEEGVPTFEAVIFVTAKQEALTPRGIVGQQPAQWTLDGIISEIGRVLDAEEIRRSAPENRDVAVLKALGGKAILLIIDNLETMENKEAIVEYFRKVQQYAPGLKLVITTREMAWFSPICLGALTDIESLTLIENEARSKEIKLNDKEKKTIYEQTGGVPAAIVYAIGQLAMEYSLEVALEEVRRPDGDVAEFYFRRLVAPLKGTAAYKLLMAVAMFPKKPTLKAAANVAGLRFGSTEEDRARTRLKHLSLITIDGQINETPRYMMLPLTREYVLAELIENQEFEKEARQRWLEGYKQLATTCGGDDWHEWYKWYDEIEIEWENFVEVFKWCLETQHYSELATLWLDQGVGEFTNIYGYWYDRLFWCEKLIENAERSGEQLRLFHALSDKGWTLTLMGQPHQLNEAEELFTRALNYIQNADLRRQHELLNNLTVLHIRQKDYEKARTLLKKGKALLEYSRDSLEERVYLRLSIYYPYYMGEIYFRKGQFNLAEKMYHQVWDLATTIEWQRAKIYAQNWLADIAIVCNNLAKAQQLLDNGLIIARQNKDKRRVGYYLRSLAYLYQKQGNQEEMRKKAQEAKEIFERLGMEQEIQELRKLLEIAS